MTMFRAIMVLMLSATPAAALDWTQPILDEQGQSISDCPTDPSTKLPAKCDKVLTIGTLTARALLSSDPSKNDSAEQKALAGNFGLEILLHHDLVPTPDQLKMARDAIGRLPSPLAVARGWAILDGAVK